MTLRSDRAPARIEGIRIRNFRALRDVELRPLAPCTVLVGPNGSGKSTVFDAFAFLAETFADGLRRAWDRRGRFKELRSRRATGPIVFELRYREQWRPRPSPVVTYHLAIDETEHGPVVDEESLAWRRAGHGRPFRILDFRRGVGQVISGERPEENDERVSERLDSPEMLAVNTLGQFAKHPRVSALRRFITGWHLSYLTADHARGVPEAGPQEHLSRTGDNLSNVVQYLGERHPDVLEQILFMLQLRVPRLERVDVENLADGRLLLQIKDAPFAEPILAKWASDGTLKMLAYLVMLNDPEPPSLVGIEEPENHLYPGLLPALAEECRAAAQRSQLMVTTHSPYYVDALHPEEVWLIHRGDDGYSRVCRGVDVQGVEAFVRHGARLGELWMEGHLGLDGAAGVNAAQR